MVKKRRKCWKKCNNKLGN